MTSDFFIHPSLLLIIGAVLLPLTKDLTRRFLLLVVPLIVFMDVMALNTSPGMHGILTFMGKWTLTFGRVDSLSSVFGFIMALMCIIGTIYSLNVKNVWVQVAAWFYVAGSLGAIYCGDYITLFLFWEMMAVASTFLVWCNTEQGALQAGYRYLLVHTTGGVILLLGFVLRYQAVGNMDFVQLSEETTHLYTWLIMAGLMLNAAVPPLHSWLPDAYSKASVAGAVFMCAFTTKTAVYTLARGFAGFDILIYLGVFMAIYGIIYAMMENDIRRLLAWEIVSQVGYMVAGVGIGTALAINGACAHAFAHILYKSLLFMAAGAVVHATGKSKLTELGGLFRKMPLTLIFLLVGGVSVSAFPWFSGFVSKSMIITASFEDHLVIAGFLLSIVSVGTFFVAGLRLPYYLFFGESHCSEETMKKAVDPPWNMTLAMTIAAGLCLVVGCYLPFLYNMLPYAVEYNPYNTGHVVETLQIIAFTVLAFIFLKGFVKPTNTISLDLDWFYRRGGQYFLKLASGPIQSADTAWGKLYKNVGMADLMSSAKFWSWFDWNVIDTIVDGTARSVLGIGRRVTVVLQKGQIQQTLYISLTFAAILLTAFVWL
ncbi:Na(+)/H(+) antiporter subunit D [Desulforhopalus vacuolatus]|uniref:Na(+)/H(+) antiporter subunit D n=1 Tax=Desulforhopalus vacuolatus TaxID=40414 RepID=UPI001962B419|nr:Na(+)/H(+) antiporter subunit D [Desulforhopalus vacuolatus]MBM9518666.1 Na(+)/H(+) antiporter subunit D [Desulforhopalus vacuolatus]